MENAIRKRLGDPKVVLTLRCHIPHDVTSRGRVLLGEYIHMDEEIQGRVFDLVDKKVREMGSFFLINMDAAWRLDHWEVFAEIHGERVVTAGEVKELEALISKQGKRTLHLNVWPRVGMVVTESGVVSSKKFLRFHKVEKRLEKMKTNIQTAKGR